MIEPLFKRYTEGHTIGELDAPRLPKSVNVAVSDDRMKELGYVETASGWVHTTEAVLLPQGGKLAWVRL